MKKDIIDNLFGTVIVPIGIATVLVPISKLIGWNFATLFLFWFVLIPVISIYLPALISSSKNHILKSVIGLLLFYGIMVFMIYDHYKTDYYKIMMISCVINGVLVFVVTALKRQKALTENHQRNL
jgi:type IV secretory pathway TraG/TraD family ATPase VirD4